METIRKKSVRKRWLISFLVLVGVEILSNLFDFQQAQEIKGRVGASLATIKVFIWSLITYHCAYRKKGSVWLILIKVFVPIGAFLYTILDFCKMIRFCGGGSIFLDVVWTAIREQPVVVWMFITAILPFIALPVWFYINCLMLLRENMALEKEAQKQSLIEEESSNS